jgi:Derlin-2/3
MAIESILVYGGLLSGRWIIFEKSYLWQLPPQFWRLATSFLLTGPGFNFVFDLYFTWIYGTGLELNSPRFTQPGDFFTYVVFLAAVILVSNPLHCISSVPYAPQHICPASHPSSWFGS